MSKTDVDAGDPHASTSWHPAAAWYGVAVLLVAYTFGFIDRTILALLVEPIKHRFQLNDSQVSLLHGLAFAIFYTTLGLPISREIDRRNRRNIIAWGIALWSVMTVACGFAMSYAQLFLARIGVGIGEAALSPAAYSMISDWFRREQLGRALSSYSAGICLGAGLAYVLGGLALHFVASPTLYSLPFLGSVGTFPAIFMLVGLPGVLVAVVARLSVREPARRSPGTPVAGAGELRAFFSRNRRTLICHAAGFSLNALMLIGFLAWAPTLYIRKFGMPPGKAALPLGLTLLVFGTVGMIGGGILGDHLVRRGQSNGLLKAAFIGSLGVMPCALGIAIAPSSGQCTVAFGAFFFFVNLPIGLGPSSLQCMTPDSMRAQVSAVYICMLNIVATAVGPTAIALCTDYLFKRPAAVDLSLALVTVIVCPVATAMFYLGLRPYSGSVLTMSDKKAPDRDEQKTNDGLIHTYQLHRKKG